MKRCIELAPGLTNGKGVEALSIVRHAVGLRPLRIGGVRLEKEKVDGVWVVHNYGHGGFGCKLDFFGFFIGFQGVVFWEGVKARGLSPRILTLGI